MTRTEQSLISELLDAATAAGADGADAMLARGEGTSVDLRLGKVEASERSEDFDAGLRVFVGQRNASISTSQKGTTLAFAPLRGVSRRRGDEVATDALGFERRPFESNRPRWNRTRRGDGIGPIGSRT